jgi:hypothetical protein
MLLLLDFIENKNRALPLSPEGDLTARGEKIIDHTPWEDLTSRRFRWSTLILCSDMSKFVTGIVIHVDGGFAATSI